YEARQQTGGGRQTREEQIRALQEKQAPDQGFSDAAPARGGKRTAFGGHNAPLREQFQQAPAAAASKPDDYYSAAPTGSTANYFADRLNEEQNPHKARLAQLREQRYRDEANGIVKENVCGVNTGQQGGPVGKAGLGRMPGGGSSINLSWS
ncbi:hypothetical protein TeGR_g11144, partial [Tetraparma gracilis]